MRAVSIVGARPQFVKAAAISRALQEAGIAELLVHTGQHYDANMAQVFFDELELPAPGVELGIGSGPHAQQTGRMMMALEPILEANRPDWVLVYGDTNSTVAGSLTAAKLHLPIAHVEAGLRSFNRRMPEEINRIVTDALSDLLLAPTDTAVRNLLNEGVPSRRIALVGDVMYDVARLFAGAAARRSGAPGKFGLEPGKYVLATIHRAENTDDPARLRTIFQGLEGVSATQTIVWPLHPRTRKALRELGLNRKPAGRLMLIDPVAYFDMLQLERHASAIVTDSGGVQKEAFFHRVPCVTLRDETEWAELVDSGWNQLCPPTTAQAITEAVRASIGRRGRDVSPYGAGDAARRVAQALGAGTLSQGKCCTKKQNLHDGLRTIAGLSL